MGFSLLDVVAPGLGLVDRATGGNISDGLDDFLGADDRREQRRAAESADAEAARASGFADQERASTVAYMDEARGQMADDRERWSNIYAPMEQSLADQVNNPAAVEDAAVRAGEDFTGQYDMSRQAQVRDDMRYGVQPGSAQAQRSADRSAFDRAQGAAGAATNARSEESDRQFLRQSAFFQQGASPLRQQLMGQLNGIYGADVASLGNQQQSAYYNSDRLQGISDQHGQDAMAGPNMLAQMGGMALSAFAGNPAGVAAGAMNAGQQSAAASQGVWAGDANPASGPTIVPPDFSGSFSSNPSTAFGSVPQNKTANFNAMSRDAGNRSQAPGAFGVLRGEQINTGKY